MQKIIVTHMLVAAILCMATVASADTTKGQGIYMNFCASCHAGGIAGAPKTGDVTAWQPRIAKGEAAVISNAIKGFQGASGFMPARGGNSALTDEEVTAAVLFMLEQSR